MLFRSLNYDAKPLILEYTPNALSLGRLVVQDGFSFHWDAYSPSPVLTRPDGRRIALPTDHFVPYVEENSPSGYACPTAMWFTAKIGMERPTDEPADRTPEQGMVRLSSADEGLAAVNSDKEKDKECRSLLAPVPLRSSFSSLAQGIRSQGSSTHSRSTPKQIGRAHV